MADRAVLYARTSGDDRGKGNIEEQLRLCREYAASQGYQVVSEVSEDDRGASGAAWDLPGLKRALDMAEAGGCDVLIAREIDRLARDLAKQLTIERHLRTFSVRVEYARQTYTDTAEGRLQKHLIASIGEYEREQIALRTSRGKRARVRRGGVMVAGRPPYGYTVERANDGLFRLVVNEAEARTVRQVFRWYAEGKSLNMISERLAELSIPTPSEINPSKMRRKKTADRCDWSRPTLRKIIRSETYAGLWRYRGDDPVNRLEVEVPALVERDLWQRAQDRLETNRHNATRKTVYPYLLRGRIRCECGLMMVGKTLTHRSGKKYVYYVCPGTGKQLGKRCHAPMVRADAVEGVVWSKIRQALQDPANVAEALASHHEQQERLAGPLREQIALIDGRLEAERGQLARLLDLYLEGGFDKRGLARRRETIERTIQSLEAKRGQASEILERGLADEEGLRRLKSVARDLAPKLRAAEKSAKTKRLIVEAVEVWAQMPGPTLHGPLSVSLTETST